ncbi:MAG: putative cytochrome c oxidase subunit [Ilumatobacteraceae bacterium]|nr:putative cytochrome c oxidase subunit [Ilumatobacteraceae bacterium]
MHALPAAPAPAPRRQLFVGTAVACAAGASLFGGMFALYFRFRQAALAVPKGEWRPAVAQVPEVATNNMLIAFLGIFVFAQWAVYAARRDSRAHVGMALGLVTLVGVAVLNGQAFVYHQMRLAVNGGQYETMFYALTGTFVAFMIAGLVYTFVTAFRYLGGRTRDREIVSAHAMFWYFLGAVYAVLWFVVYVTK